MATETSLSLTGAACSLVLHAVVGTLCFVNLDWAKPVSRTPEVFMVSFAPVLHHSEELSRGSPGGTTIMPARMPQPEVAPPVRQRKAAVKPEPQPRAMLKMKERVQTDPAPKRSTAESAGALATTESQPPGSTSGTNQVPGELLGQNGTAAPGSGNYEALIVSHLTSAKRYPERARRRGMEGDVVVDIQLARDGSLERARLVRPSSWEVLNDEVLEMVQRAAPFPPVPHNYLPGQRVGFTIPIRFQLH